MTVVHPLLGIVTAISPKIGDASTSNYSQTAMALWGASSSLIIHLIKVALRLAGLGCLTPCIALVEQVVCLVTCPLAIYFSYCEWVHGACRVGASSHLGPKVWYVAVQVLTTVPTCRVAVLPN